ncbi:hypothetical protein RQM65_07450 [Pricia sp. S334]|uniref:Uncharacterized protein n=1 Tax=Pricia mediterranea TaxID=3076079 RepID=A0ABU3L534_9FLAO|nr:hypothetical protein [Pricia sp. S334]MDT7828493.1 hypothetical protein [Pricia sp. S334]
MKRRIPNIKANPTEIRREDRSANRYDLFNLLAMVKKYWSPHQNFFMLVGKNG